MASEYGGAEAYESTEPSITRRPDAIPGTVMSASREWPPAPQRICRRQDVDHDSACPSGRSSRLGSGASAAWVSM